MSEPKNILQLDVGNSAAKWRLVCEGDVLARGAADLDEIASLPAALPATKSPHAIWISSVASAAANTQLQETLSSSLKVSPWFAETQAQTCSLVNSYAEPRKMGVDRWLAMLGAQARFPGRALLVVDVGSAMTLDLVAEDGRHEGGYIIPGPMLMERALLLDTDRVRFDEDIDYRLAPGRSTAEAVRHGIALAQVGAVQAVADHNQRKLVLTGGGATVLSQLLGGSGELIPDLVIEGLAVMAAAEGMVKRD